MRKTYENFKEMVNRGKRIHPYFYILWWMRIIIEIIHPFMMMVLPAVVIWLGSHTSFSEACSLFALFLMVLGGCLFLSSWLDQFLFSLLVNLRFLYMSELTNQTMLMDYTNLEQVEKRDTLDEVMRYSVYMNQYGFEAMFREFSILISSVGGMVLYALLLAQVNLFWMMLLFVLALFQIVVYRKAIAYETNHKQDWTKEARLFNAYEYYFTKPDPAKDIRLYQMDHLIMKQMQSFRNHILEWKNNIQKQYQVSQGFELLLLLTRDIIAYGWLVKQVFDGKMSVESFVLYVSVITTMSTWMKQIVHSWNHLKMDDMGIKSYHKFMKDMKVAEDQEELPHFEGNIVFDHVSFTYADGSSCIQDFSFCIHAKEKLAIVGLNGAGKSTLMKLLCGLYEPSAGMIYIDDVPVACLSAKQKSKLFSVVFQDASVFAFSLAMNVACEKQYDQEKVWDALTKVGLKEVVEALPLGIKTPMTTIIEENGLELSGGQTAKLLLARALYHEGNILILDEPTAALDALAESELYTHYASMCEKKTSLFISHRLASTRFCDRILYLENGRVVEVGTHEELLMKKGKYAELYELQAKQYQEEIL